MMLCKMKHRLIQLIKLYSQYGEWNLVTMCEKQCYVRENFVHYFVFSKFNRSCSRHVSVKDTKLATRQKTKEMISQQPKKKKTTKKTL